MENTEQLKAENEKLHQELHIFKRKLYLATKINAELSEDFQQQQDRLTREAHEMRAKYENQLKVHKITIEKLKAEILETIYPEPTVAVPEAPIIVQEGQTNRNAQEREEQLEQHQAEICKLQQKLTALGQNFAQSQWKISELSEEVDCLKEQLASQKGNLEIKTQQLTELRELLESTQEQNGLLSAELARIRSDPTDPNQKGNSLFAEVADQRKKLMNNVTQIKARYFELKREHQDCPRQIRELQNMHHRSERLYEQCVKLIRSAEYYTVSTLMEQNKDLHGQVEDANRRIRYLEREMATKSPDWLSKLLTLNREEKQKLEDRLRSYQFKQREAMELHEDAVKESWKWQIEVQRMKLRAINMEVPSAPVASASDTVIAEMEDKSGTQPIEEACAFVKDRTGEAACTTITVEDPIPFPIPRGELQACTTIKVEDPIPFPIPRGELQACTTIKVEDPIPFPITGGELQACTTITVEDPIPFPIPGGELQASKKEPEQTLPNFKIVPLKCYKISEMMAMHKKQKNPKDNAHDAEVDSNSSNSASKTMPE